MPDKWEYPWFAAWDLAFHTLALDDGRPGRSPSSQLDLMLSERYLHPSGQIPAYEWNFGDVNPPVHAWADIFAYNAGAGARGERRPRVPEEVFHKLLLNFTWWVNRKDRSGNNVFEGGFLGLDNIGVFDRSAALPTGGHLEQADGTAWMALFSQNMLEIAIELAARGPDLRRHGAQVLRALHAGSPSAMDRASGGARRDVGRGGRLLLRRAADARRQRDPAEGPLDGRAAAPVRHDGHRARRDPSRCPELGERGPPVPRAQPGARGEHRPPCDPGRRTAACLLSVVNEHKLRRILETMLDEERVPRALTASGRSRGTTRITRTSSTSAGGSTASYYLPAESDIGMFGGNSNWRGPIWFPVNALLIRALCSSTSTTATSSRSSARPARARDDPVRGRERDRGPARRASSSATTTGRRPVYGGAAKFQDDPHWRDLILFYEYFHGDNGAGLGASHQTGWTGASRR